MDIKSIKEAHNTRCRNYYHQNIDKMRKYKREWERKNRENSGRVWELKKDFGITIQEYNQLFLLQGGCCAICGKHQSKEWRRLSVDHCHQSSKIRGLLCSVCNRALGLFKDNPELLRLLRKSVEYLNSHA